MDSQKPFNFEGRPTPVIPGNIPYIGAPMNIRETDSERSQPAIGKHVFVRRLDLSDPDHLATFQKISQRYALEHVEPSFESIEYNSETKNWVVLVRWSEYYQYDPAQYPGEVPHPDQLSMKEK